MTYKVRLANLQDIDWIVKDAGRQMIFDELHEPAFYDPHRLTQLTMDVLNRGVIFILMKNTKPVGVLGGFAAPHYFTPKIKTLFSLFLYIQPASRNGSGFYRLLCAYREYAKEQGLECVLTLRDVSNLNPKSLTKLGFKQDETSYRLKG